MPDSCLSVMSVDLGDERLVAVTGELCLSSAALLVRSAAAALDPPPSRLVLDLRGVTLLSSDGIAALVKVAVRCTSAGVPLQVLLGEVSERVLSLCGLMRAGAIEWVPAERPTTAPA
jgi:anti-anti-sigma factor